MSRSQHLARLSMALCCLAPTVLVGVHPERVVSGVWSGVLGGAGVERQISFALHERRAGELIGYVLGGTRSLTMTEGRVSRAGIEVQIESVLPTGIEIVEIRGGARGDELAALVRSNGRVSRVQFRRVESASVLERRLLVVSVDSSGEPEYAFDFGLVETSLGAFAGGNYTSRTTCAVLGCAGVVTDYVESFDADGNPAIEMSLAIGGSCPGQGTIDLAYDPSFRLYVGAFVFEDCSETRSGSLLGSGLTRTRGDHALSMLATYGRLADDLEQRTEFVIPHTSFAPDYLHRSVTLQARLDELNAEIATYDAIDVELSRFRDLHTIEDPYVFPDLSFGFNVDFRDRRVGQSATQSVVYRSGYTRDGNDELAFIREDAGHWVIEGDQIAHDLPFASYAFGPRSVDVPAGSGSIHVSVGTWGAHAPPHTGHIDGDTKANWIGLYADSYGSMTELEGDGNGICVLGEACGVPAADLIDRAISYVAPGDDFRVIEVRLERIEPPGLYFGGVEHWRIRGNLKHYNFDYVHLRRIAPDLRTAMIAAGYPDPWTVHTASDNLITGEPVVLSHGQTVAWPQIVASPVAGHPGYFVGGGAIDQAPWQQLEIFTRNNLAERSESFYTWLASDLQERLAATLTAEALHPGSFRYTSPFVVGVEFAWRAEMALSNQPFSDGSDYSSVFAALGAWWEDADGCSVPTLCDEIFSIFPISKGTVFYDPTLYDSSDVTYLVIHQLSGDPAPVLFGEVVQPFEPDPVSGNMVLKWRSFDGVPLGYQSVGYRLDSAGGVLRIRWGAMSATLADALNSAPPVPTGMEPCDGVALTCHDHGRN